MAVTMIQIRGICPKIWPLTMLLILGLLLPNPGLCIKCSLEAGGEEECKDINATIGPGGQGGEKVTPDSCQINNVPSSLFGPVALALPQLAPGKGCSPIPKAMAACLRNKFPNSPENCIQGTQKMFQENLDQATILGCAVVSGIGGGRRRRETQGPASGSEYYHFCWCDTDNCNANLKAPEEPSKPPSPSGSDKSVANSKMAAINGFLLVAGLLFGVIGTRTATEGSMFQSSAS